MPIAQVILTDTFDQWRQKTNLMIDSVNSLAVNGDVLSITTPTTGDILIYNGTFFQNVSVSGDITIAPNGSVTVTGGGSGNTKGRLAFAGSAKGLY